ncbi:MAG: DUF2325 domain-containing protein [Oscillospiraceae bacterium]|nr:DUF2325 domain-containing protein [Oscillospiraceae bacterium]MBQ9937986.1 DUF2325 domain-containing protein [Oscillospiraceae bacterium]
MSVVIVGGNECMVRQYIDLCKKYNCRAKVFCKMHDGLKNKVGNPDLMVLLTNTTSHKMVRCAISEIKGQNTVVARSHSSSISALKNILEAHTAQEVTPCPKS